MTWSYDLSIPWVARLTVLQSIGYSKWMFAMRTWSRKCYRLVRAVGVVAILGGLGMDVHAIMMVTQGSHGPKVEATDSPLHDHGVSQVGHSHTTPNTTSDDFPEGGSSFECCSVTLCPPSALVLPPSLCESDHADNTGPAIPIRISRFASVEHIPLLRPPK